METKWIVYSKYGVQTHGFQTKTKMNFITGNLKSETLYDNSEDALLNTDNFYDEVCEVSSLIKIEKFIFG